MRDDRVVVNPQKLCEYAESMKNNCKQMQERQAQTERTFKKMGESWNDEIYFAACKSMYHVSKGLENIFSVIVKAISGTVIYFNTYAQIQGLKQSLDMDVNLLNFNTSIKEEGYSMQENKITDFEEMRKFIAGIEDYVDDTRKIIKAIKNEHEQIGRERAWVTPQYAQLSEVLESVSKSTEVQLNELELAKDMTKFCYEKMIELNNMKLDV